MADKSQYRDSKPKFKKKRLRRPEDQPSFWQDRYEYSPSCGGIYRKSSGARCDNISASGYRIVAQFNKPWLAHRIAWVLHYGCWPKSEIDHINRDKADNRIDNLRDVSTSINQRNRTANKKSKNPYSGVRYRPDRECWYANIRVDGVDKYLGTFANFGDALKARLEAERKYGFRPGRTDWQTIGELAAALAAKAGAK